MRVASPDSRNRVRAEVREGGLYYSLERDGRPIILPSRLGFEFRSAPPLWDGLGISGSENASVDETWTQPWGEVTTIRDHHNQLTIRVTEARALNRQFTVVFRAFDDGVGFRYELPTQPTS